MSSAPKPPALPPRPWMARLLEAVGSGLRGVGLPLFPLDQARLIARARRQTGLHDLGDEAFLPAMDRVLELLRRADLTFIGQAFAYEELTRVLVNRLHLQQALRDDPELDARPLGPVIVIVGMPRTGTTLLHHGLALDPAARCLPLWLLAEPLPAPDAALWAASGGARLRRARLFVRHASWVWPGLEHKHPIAAHLPEEEAPLLALDFTSLFFWVRFPIPNYVDWLVQQDATQSYLWFRRALAVLQASRPGSHWVLKTPAHLPFLDTLVTQVPEARLVFTNRDVAEVAPSLFSLFQSMHGGMTRTPDLGAMVQANLRLFEGALATARQVRAGLPRDRFLDLPYERIVADPVAAVRAIHSHFGLPFTEEHERAFGARAPRGPPHRYALADWGLTAEDLRSRFPPWEPARETGPPRSRSPR